MIDSDLKKLLIPFFFVNFIISMWVFKFLMKFFIIICFFFFFFFLFVTKKTFFVGDGVNTIIDTVESGLSVVPTPEELAHEAKETENLHLQQDKGKNWFRKLFSLHDIMF